MAESCTGNGGHHQPPGRIGCDGGAQMVGAMVVGADRLAEQGRGDGRRRGGQAGQAGQRRQQEQDGADQGGHRVARHAEDRQASAPRPAEQQRLSGPHGDLPEVHHHAAALQALDDQVVVADRGAARGHQHVGAGDRIGDRGDRLARVGGDRQHGGQAAGGAHQRGQRVRVGGDDAAGRDRLARHGDLVTGGQDGDARAAMHAEPGVVGRGGEAHVACGDAAAGGHHGVAAGEVLAGAANVAAGLHRFVDPHGVAVTGGVLLQQDGVGTLRDNAAGEQSHGLAGADACRRRDGPPGRRRSRASWSRGRRRRRAARSRPWRRRRPGAA